MKFPLDKVINSSINKFETAAAMIKYAGKLEEIPELLAEYTEKEREKRLRIIMSDILDGKIKYKLGSGETK